MFGTKTHFTVDLWKHQAKQSAWQHLELSHYQCAKLHRSQVWIFTIPGWELRNTSQTTMVAEGSQYMFKGFAMLCISNIWNHQDPSTICAAYMDSHQIVYLVVVAVVVLVVQVIEIRLLDTTPVANLKPHLVPLVQPLADLAMKPSGAHIYTFAQLTLKKGEKNRKKQTKKTAVIEPFRPSVTCALKGILHLQKSHPFQSIILCVWHLWRVRWHILPSPLCGVR